MSELHDLSVREIAAGVRDRTLSPVEVVRRALARCERLEPAVRAWATLYSDGALKAAEHLERQIAAGEGDSLLLAGVPVGVKDIFDAVGLPTTAAFAPYANRVAAHDATAVARLRAAGAIVLGKTVTTQFAFADPPPTRNPWHAGRTPGGSSSGSAAAVAVRMVPAALGSQTAGSVLRPAGYCGVVGLKPTYGRISIAGVLPDAWSLDHVGVLAGSVDDSALLLQALAGYDPLDPASARRQVPAYADQVNRPLSRPRLGLAVDFLDRAAPDVRDHLLGLARRCEAAGALVREVALPMAFDLVLAVHRAIMQVEMAAAHRSTLARYPDDYGPLLRSFVEIGQLIPGDVYVHAQRLRRCFHAALPVLFDGLDGLLCPTASGVAPDPSTTGDRTFQAVWTLVGVPALSIPTGLNADGLPFATQVVAPAFKEGQLLALGRWLETIVGPPARPPVAAFGSARGLPAE